MSCAIPSHEQADLRCASLAAQYPDGPPMAPGKTFSRFAVARYAMGEQPAQWGIVVRWRYQPTEERPDLGAHEMGGGFVNFTHGVPTDWNA